MEVQEYDDLTVDDLMFVDKEIGYIKFFLLNKYKMNIKEVYEAMRISGIRGILLNDLTATDHDPAESWAKEIYNCWVKHKEG